MSSGPRRWRTSPPTGGRRPAPRRAAHRDAFLAELSPGDYVVHIEHGIARFAGLTRRMVAGSAVVGAASPMASQVLRGTLAAARVATQRHAGVFRQSVRPALATGAAEKDGLTVEAAVEEAGAWVTGDGHEDGLRPGPLVATVTATLGHPRLVALRFEGSAAAVWAGLARQVGAVPVDSLNEFVDALRRVAAGGELLEPRILRRPVHVVQRLAQRRQEIRLAARGLADGCLGERLADVPTAGGQRAVPGVGAADQQEFARVVGDRHVDRGDDGSCRWGDRVVVVVDPARHRLVTQGLGSRLPRPARNCPGRWSRSPHPQPFSDAKRGPGRQSRHTHAC